MKADRYKAASSFSAQRTAREIRLFRVSMQPKPILAASILCRQSCRTAAHAAALVFRPTSNCWNKR